MVLCINQWFIVIHDEETINIKSISLRVKQIIKVPSAKHARPTKNQDYCPSTCQQSTIGNLLPLTYQLPVGKWGNPRPRVADGNLPMVYARLLSLPTVESNARLAILTILVVTAEMRFTDDLIFSL